ncbi:MAG TPA: hypothetical protein VHD90_08330 [Phototrophicaceae bacterium]|nr:hypothetical protein [Phototrophicaceae bacterium]
MAFPPALEREIKALNQRLANIEGLLNTIAQNTQRGACVDFQTFPAGNGPNPRKENGFTFTAADNRGIALPNTLIGGRPAPGGVLLTALELPLSLTVDLILDCDVVEIDVLAQSNLEIASLDANGAAIDKVGIAKTGNLETRTVVGVGAVSVLITADSLYDSLLLKFCCACRC